MLLPTSSMGRYVERDTAAVSFAEEGLAAAVKRSEPELAWVELSVVEGEEVSSVVVVPALDVAAEEWSVAAIVQFDGTVRSSSCSRVRSFGRGRCRTRGRRCLNRRGIQRRNQYESGFM